MPWPPATGLGLPWVAPGKHGDCWGLASSGAFANHQSLFGGFIVVFCWPVRHYSRQPVCYCRTSHHGVFPSGEYIVQFVRRDRRKLVKASQPKHCGIAAHRSGGEHAPSFQSLWHRELSHRCKRTRDQQQSMTHSPSVLLRPSCPTITGLLIEGPRQRHASFPPIPERRRVS
ncbi:hypothetical protein FJTKL_12255 [Diaporthe vaccinii]|uniref:Uncharacterized protein n=1 Tax=Diaporthe vaccinii TaxID=105482 RepID=A0ABR4EE56_9PEZI